ncbi:MAG: hypothetical protein K0R54_37 [Clostridiaceae bacterium]|jgi:DNA-binding XRE family transcriptional regulator|nr:hypothetical protein [Clostridiaceae bacterium]
MNHNELNEFDEYKKLLKEAKDSLNEALKTGYNTEIAKGKIDLLPTDTEEQKENKKTLFNVLKSIPYKSKIESLSYLTDMGLNIIDEDELVVSNKIMDILNEKELRVSHLAELTGIPRQNINAVVKNKMKPGIDFALKVSYVLNIPVEDLFILNDNAWVAPYKPDKDSTLYVDIVDMEVIDNRVRKSKIANNGYEYFHKKTNEFITKNDKDLLQKEYVEKNKVQKINEMKEEDTDNELSLNQINSQAIEELKNEFNKQYTKIYNKLGKTVKPYKL